MKTRDEMASEHLEEDQISFKMAMESLVKTFEKLLSYAEKDKWPSVQKGIQKIIKDEVAPKKVITALEAVDMAIDDEEYDTALKRLKRAKKLLDDSMVYAYGYGYGYADGKKDADFDAVKFMDKDGVKIAGYAIIYGDPDHPDISSFKDFFTPETDFWLDKWDKRPMIYHHSFVKEDFEPVVGVWTKAVKDEIGVWLEGELNKAHKYYEAIKELVARGALKISSDSASHLIRRVPLTNGTHQVTRWPLLAASLTPTPAEPRLLPVAQLKSAYKALDIPIPDFVEEEVKAINIKKTLQEIADLVKKALDALDKYPEPEGYGYAEDKYPAPRTKAAGTKSDTQPDEEPENSELISFLRETKAHFEKLIGG